MSIFAGTELDKIILEKLEKAGLFRKKHLIELSDCELRKLASLTSEECSIVKEVSSKLFLKTTFNLVPAVSSLNEDRRITFDCPLINKLTGGGLPLKGITELYGESGAGKTQICLQLSLTVQYPESYGGLSSGAVYICTEDKYPTNRLNQMLPHFPRNLLLKKQMKNATFGERIYVDHIADVDGLKECIFHRLPKLLSDTSVGLIIIDSIAAVYRSEFSFKQTLERAKSIREVALQLHRISKKFNTAVLCVNQVSDSMEGSHEKMPALGLVWANMVTTKLKAYRYPKRALKMESAPDLPSNFCYYRISDQGVFGSESSQE